MLHTTNYKRNKLLVAGSRDIKQHIASTTRNVGHVRVVCQRLHNRFARLDLAERNKRLAGLVEGLRDDRSSLGLTFGTDDGRLTLLLGLHTGLASP